LLVTRWRKQYEAEQKKKAEYEKAKEAYLKAVEIQNGDF